MTTHVARGGSICDDDHDVSDVGSESDVGTVADLGCDMTVSDMVHNTLFDRYVMVDWSAASSPRRGRDSIWIAQRAAATHASHDSHDPVNVPTRAAAMQLLTDLVTSAPNERVLIGVDFTCGYPHGAAEVICDGEIGSDRHRATWADVWRWMATHISDAPDNRNDRFDVAAQLNERISARVGVAPFWGYPGRERTDALPRTRPQVWAPAPPSAGDDDVGDHADQMRGAGFNVAEFRIAEQRVQARGLRPFPAWQLAYPGSVGSQMMLGMHHVERWRHQPDLKDRVRIWPFETGIGIESAHIEPGMVLVAELWPSMFDIDRSRHDVLDAAQVADVVDRLAEADANSTLADWFAPDLTPAERTVVLSEEGWTLGVT